jgi:hypothetical protein
MVLYSVSLQPRDVKAPTSGIAPVGTPIFVGVVIEGNGNSHYRSICTEMTQAQRWRGFEVHISLGLVLLYTKKVAGSCPRS